MMRPAVLRPVADIRGRHSAGSWQGMCNLLAPSALCLLPALLYLNTMMQQRLGTGWLPGFNEGRVFLIGCCHY